MKHVYFGWTYESTETFRWASRTSPKGIGFNGQTEPKAFRWMHPALPGRVFGQKDLKQAEARAVAHFAMAKRLLDIFNDPTANLYLAMGIPTLRRGEFDKESPLYTLFKSVIHACHYDEGPFKMAWDTGLSVAEAREFQENYHGLNPEIRQWHRSTVKEVISKGYLAIPYFNRKRVFYEALGFYAIHRTITDQQRKDAIAWRPQTLVPQIITNGIRVARPQLPDEVWLHHHGHDSVVWSCPPSIFGATEAVFNKALHAEILINGLVMVIPQDTGVGYALGDLMDYKGVMPSHSEWEKWRDTKVKDRKKKVLEGIYGPHIRQ